MEKPKFHLNPNEEIVKTIREGLKRTGGYCPCRLQHIPENICICKEFKEQLADPAYPQKVATGRPEDIRPCIGCNQGCIGALKVGRRAGCAVNPQAAREASFALTPAPRKKSVLVVGGGVAGMEAARCAALRGHDVTLCEGSDRLARWRGGRRREAPRTRVDDDLREAAV